MEIPGWSIVVHGLQDLLVFLNTFVGYNPGLTIIIFTVLLKLVTLPLTLKSLQSSRNMQAIQPLVKAVQQKYKEDKTKQQQEIMRIYSEHGVNPMLGCLPMLLQLPVFFAMYQALIALVNPATQYAGLPMVWSPVVSAAVSTQAPFAQPFLWIPNLASHDPLYIMPVLAAFFQFLSSRMAIPYGYSKTADPQQQTMNRMMQFMPLLIIIFYSNFAAGAVLYWAASSLFQAVQQYFITGFGAMAELPGLHWLPKKELPKITPKVVARIEEEQKKESKRKATDEPEPAPAPAKYRSEETAPAPAPALPVVADSRPQPKGLFARMMEQALATQEAQQTSRAVQTAGATAGPTDGGEEGATRPLPAAAGVDTVRLNGAPVKQGGNGTAGHNTLPRKKRGKR